MSYARKLAEAANQILNQLVTEAPAMAQSPATMFGYSSHNFESKFREILKKMGFETGYSIKQVGSVYHIFFDNAAKAKDFATTIEGLFRRVAKQGAKVVVFSPQAITGAPASTKATVTVNFAAIKEEANNEKEFAALLEEIKPIEEAVITEEDEKEEIDMAVAQLESVIENANEALVLLKQATELEAWVQSKITMADDYITTIRDYMKHGRPYNKK
jgi:acetylornithine deacetylase/succinyl-diaminopimelate desuccinylase-like protein